MKNLIPWLVAILFGLGGTFFYTTDAEKAKQIATLQPQANESRTLHTEIESANATIIVQTEEIARLKRATFETPARSNELARLREDNQQQSRQVQAEQTAKVAAQQEVQQLRAAIEQLQSAPKPVALPVTPPAVPVVPIIPHRVAATIPVPISVTAPVVPAPVAPPAPPPLSPAMAEQLQRQDMLNTCLNQLRLIDLAKQEWALENNKPSAARPSQQDLAAYLKDHIVPLCPAGGLYNFGTVEQLPTCTIPGHVFTKGP